MKLSHILDITIIEIKPDKDKINYFLELDEIIFNEDKNLGFEDMYMIQYLKLGNKEKAGISYGILKQINNFKFIHYCYTESESCGSPILNMTNNKVIGIHSESSTNLNYNKGIFLKFPINEYVNRNRLI